MASAPYQNSTVDGQGLRARALVALLLVGLAHPPTVSAQSGDDPRRRLDATRSELDESRKRTGTLEQSIRDAQADRDRLSDSLRQTARLIQESEARLTAIEGRRAELDDQQRGLKDQLSQRHGKIAVLLGAMQRMGRNPPPVMVTRREDALKMVRSAMLLARTFPELSKEALALAGRLTELARIIDQIRIEGENIRGETARLNDQRTRIAELVEARRTSLVRFQPELAEARKRAVEAARRIDDLSVLIARLDSSPAPAPARPASEPAVKSDRQTTPPSKRVEQEPVVPAPQRATPPPAAQSSPQTVTPATPATTPPPATTPAADTSPSPMVVAELRPLGTEIASLSPGRMRPSVPFANARASLPMPAQGRRVLGFGERTQYGGQSKGLVIETRHSAQVISPCDGWVLFAGEFRTFGQLLIINGDDGYHVLLAGLSQIDVQVGQFVLAGEPVGVMSAPPKAVAAKADGNAPVLYVEFRKDNRPINPDPWWTARSQRVQG